MNKISKALAAIMLMTAVLFTTGCNNNSSTDKGENIGKGGESVGNGTFNGHDFVDLGLPSGTLWATCNVGANSPEEYGTYFAWGETEPMTIDNCDTYKYRNGLELEQLTKYCNDFKCGYNGFTDNLTVLQPGDDAATSNWGSGWCMPTADQWSELYQNTTFAWTAQNGVKGRLFTANNGNTLFLPAAGHFDYDYDYVYNMLENVDMPVKVGIIVNENWVGYYWSSSLFTDYPNYAWYFFFDSDYYTMEGRDRLSGQSVRAVRSSSQN